MAENQQIPSEEAPPVLVVPVASTIAALALFAACIFAAFGEPALTTGVVMVVSTVIVVAVAVLQWVLYGWAYIDYRIEQRCSQSESQNAPMQRTSRGGA